MAPILHESGGAVLSPVGSVPNLRAMNEGTDEPAGEQEIPQREGRYGGEGPLCVGPTSGEGGMHLEARVVPWH